VTIKRRAERELFPEKLTNTGPRCEKEVWGFKSSKSPSRIRKRKSGCSKEDFQRDFDIGRFKEIASRTGGEQRSVEKRGLV